MSYEKDFQKFLSYTNEKEVIFKKTIEKIESRNVNSILDIGAGEGILSIPLSKKVKRYVAVEENKNFAEKLKSNGIEVIEGRFPLSVDDKFDMVLVSHAHPDQNYEHFISSAWKLVNEKGCLFVVTYKDEESEWVNLLKEIGEEKVEIDRVDYKKIISYMSKIGEVSVEKETSYVCAPTVEELFEALSFVFSDGDLEKKERFALQKDLLCDIFNPKHRSGKLFCFPFQQFFITLVNF